MQLGEEVDIYHVSCVISISTQYFYSKSYTKILNIEFNLALRGLIKKKKLIDILSVKPITLPFV